MSTSSTTAPPDATDSGRTVALPYPATRTTDAEELLAGVAFADPYRWLELEDAEVHEWDRQQRDLTRQYIREWPAFSRVRELTTQLSAAPAAVLPRAAGGQWFRLARGVPNGRPMVWVSDEPCRGGRLLVDPEQLDPDGRTTISWMSPSPDGRVLAVGICADGTERNVIQLLDVASGDALAAAPPQTLTDGWTGGVTWLPDSTGFYFAAPDPDAESLAPLRIYHHSLTDGDTRIEAVPLLPEPGPPLISASRDGRWVLVTQRMMNPAPVAVLDRLAPEQGWRALPPPGPHALAGVVLDATLFAVTDRGAPRGRVVAVALEGDDVTKPERWREIVPESEAVIRSITQVGSTLYLAELLDTYARVRMVDLEGQELGCVPLPGRGALSDAPYPLLNLVERGHPDRYVFAFSTLTSSWGTYLHDPGAEHVETLHDPQVVLEGAVVEDRWAVSRDGTRIPYHVVRPGHVGDDQPLPALLYGYGGFNVALTPKFVSAFVPFVAAGGSFVHVHLRGGGELGSQWWQEGRMQRKQASYDDLYAVAEDLVASGRAPADGLSFMGGSHGGLLACVALTQRPDLWRAVVARVPMTDLIAASRDPYGRAVVTIEMADVEDETEVRRLASMSPYQLVEDGTDYPAVLLDAGAVDPRCPPWHARKLAARLQAVRGARTVLLQVRADAGHGTVADPEDQLDLDAECLTFLVRELGMELT